MIGFHCFKVKESCIQSVMHSRPQSSLFWHYPVASLVSPVFLKELVQEYLETL